MTETPLPRSQFPVCERFHYLNHAGVSPLPIAAQKAIAEITDDFVRAGAANFDHWQDAQERARSAAAALLGVDPSDLAFVKNTTEGLGFVANGLSWKRGDRVIVPDFEFPSTIYPWLSLRELGVEVDIIKPVGETHALPIEVFAEALEDNERRGGTKLVAASWVQYARGYRLDAPRLVELAHRYGAMVCLDVIQGAGLIPTALEDWNVDFAMADSHKWMLGPVGIGVFYVASRCRHLLRPLEPGWASVIHRDDFENLDLAYDDTARRFEGGTYNNITICGMHASIDLILKAGTEQLWRHVDTLADHLATGLGGLGATVLSDRAEGRSGIVTFAVPGSDTSTVADLVAQRGFQVSVRGGGVRVSPHGYNSLREIDDLISALRSSAL